MHCGPKLLGSLSQGEGVLVAVQGYAPQSVQSPDDARGKARLQVPDFLGVQPVRREPVGPSETVKDLLEPGKLLFVEGDPKLGNGPPLIVDTSLGFQISVQVPVYMEGLHSQGS